MRKEIYRRELVEVEREAPGTMASVAQALRISDDRAIDGERDSPEPYIRITRADLDREARDGDKLEKRRALMDDWATALETRKVEELASRRAVQ